MKQLASSLAVALLFTGFANAQLPPEKALQSLRVADGLQVELFASEPMFTNPTCIDVDHKGRVWVCESVNYRHRLRNTKANRPEGDRLVVLEDTDGDGKADKSHTFYQAPDFLAPLGVAVAPYPDGKGQKVYVCHSPYIYLFEDRDGDLKADAAPKILLKGFKGFDHDHGVHGIHIGPDGKLYFSVGDQGVDNLSSSNGDIKPAASGKGEGEQGKEKVWTTNRTDCQAGTVWRCNPDGSGLELIAHNFRNEYEPAVNSFGTIFVSDNDDDGNQQTRMCYVMPGGNHGYWPRNKGDHHWHEDQPGVVHKVMRTGFGSPTGLCWYEGSLLPLSRYAPDPARCEGFLLHTDAGPREVRCFVVRPKGAGYELDKIDLVTSTDNWFRPSDVCVAPDGSVFISDWYDPGVGGHGMGDITRGRIYRLTPRGHAAYKVPALQLADTQGILQTLASPNLAAREAARNHMHIVDDRTLRDRLPKAKAPSAETYKDAVLLWEAARRNLAGSGYWLGDHLASKDERMRTLVIRIQKDFFKIEPTRFVSHDSKLHWGNVREDVSPAVRREALLALRNLQPERAGQEPGTTVSSGIMDLALKYDGQDQFYLAAINVAVGADTKRREVILADFEKRFPGWNEKAARLVWELRPPQVVARLDQKLADPMLAPEQKGFILDILAHADAEAGSKLLKLLQEPNLAPALRGQVVSILARHLPRNWKSLQNDPDLKKTTRAFLAKAETQPLAVQLIAAAETPELGDALVDLANSASASAEVRRAAVQALGGWKTDRFVVPLATLMDQRDLQKEAVAALGKVGLPKAIALLEETLRDDRRPADLRSQALSALTDSRPGSQRLLQLLDARQVPDSLRADAGQLLRNSPYADLRNKAMVAVPAPGKMDMNKLPEIPRLVPRKGNLEHGREIVTRNKDVGCVRCHAIRGVGGHIGPDLSMIGKKASRENLFESIMFPDKAIADQFIQHMVLDRKGVTVTGLLVEDAPEHVVLRDGLGKDIKIPTAEIEQRGKSKKSIMPSDLLPLLSEQDLIDVVEYLGTLQTPAYTPESWRILGPFDNGAGDEGLVKALSPEKHLLENAEGNTSLPLATAYEGKHSKVVWRTIRPNAASYLDLAAFYAGQSSQIVSYLLHEIESPVEQDATVLIGTDDGCKLWVNGKEVLSHQRHEAATPERDRVPVKLKQGRNTILMKINNGDGPHGFYFTVVSGQELKGK